MKKPLSALCALVSVAAMATDFYCRKDYTSLDDPNCFTVNGVIADDMPGPGDNLYFAEGDWYWLTESGTYPMYSGLAHIYMADGCTFALQPDYGSMKSTIPIVLTGETATFDNGMKGSGVEIGMDIANISSSAGTELHLADCDTTCTARNMSGRMSVVSDGSWMLAGNQTFTGPVTVNSGTLALSVPPAPKHKPFKFYRFSICQIGDEKWAGWNGEPGQSDPWLGEGEITSLREFCLYDADGNRVNKDFFCNNQLVANSTEPGECVTPVKNLNALEQGEVTFDESMDGWVSSFNNNLTDIFDGDGNTMVNIRFRGGANHWTHVRPVTGNYWAFIMRMPEDEDGNTAEVTHFNFQFGGCSKENYDKQTIRRFKLEGSPDGEEWATVWTNEKGKGDEVLWHYEQWGEGYGNYYWLSNASMSLASPYDTEMAYDENYAYNTTATDYIEEVDNTTPYRWYRVSFANIGPDNNEGNTVLNMRQFCLYDKNGKCINKDLEVIYDIPDFPNGANYNSKVQITCYTNEFAELPKGCASWDKSMSGWFAYGEGCPGNPASLARLLEGEQNYMTVFKFSSPDGYIAPNATNMGRHKWISFIMHLDDETLPATHFNAQLGYTSDQNNVPTRIVIEGSADGKDWEPVWSNLEGDLIVWNNHNDGWWNYPWLTGNEGLGAHCANQPYSDLYAYNMTATGVDPGDESVQAYKYFRFSIAEIDNGEGTSVSMRNICLYNQNGTCVNWGLQMLNQNEDHTVDDYDYVPEGYFAFDRSLVGCRYSGYDAFPAGALVNDSWPRGDGEGDNNMCEMAFKRPDNTWVKPDPADPSTWFSFVMHISETAKPVTHFDFELGFISEDVHRPTKVVLEGSFDGENWKTIYTDVGKASHVWPAGYYPWYSGSLVLNQYVASKAYNENYAYNVNSMEKVSQLGKIAYLNVMPGATFQGREEFVLSTIGLSAEQGGYGTLQDVELADNGTIKLFDVSGECTLDLPTLSNCTGSFNGWTVDAGDGYVGTVTANGIEIVAGGGGVVAEEATVGTVGFDANGKFVISFTGTEGATYVLKKATSLTAPIEWTTVKEYVATGSAQETDAMTTEGDAGFYKLEGKE